MGNENIYLKFDLNKMLTQLLSYNNREGVNDSTLEKYFLEGLSIALRYVEQNPQFFGDNIFDGEIYSGGGCSISKNTLTLSVKASGFWQLTKCYVHIDFLTGDIFLEDFDKKEKDKAQLPYGIKCEKPIDTSIVQKYLNDDYVREVHRIVVDKKEKENLLLGKEFTMYNIKNNHKGEKTTLDEKDVSDIIYDRASVYMNEEKTKVFVKYPHNICTMERNI